MPPVETGLSPSCLCIWLIFSWYLRIGLLPFIRPAAASRQCLRKRIGHPSREQPGGIVQYRVVAEFLSVIQLEIVINPCGPLDVLHLRELRPASGHIRNKSRIFLPGRYLIAFPAVVHRGAPTLQEPCSQRFVLKIDYYVRRPGFFLKVRPVLKDDTVGASRSAAPADRKPFPVTLYVLE